MMGKLQIITLMLIVQSVFGQDIAVMTYNIRFDNSADGINAWDNRKNYLIYQLQSYTPDILGTQEGLTHQLVEIDKELTDYAFFGVGRDDGNKAGEYTGIFYNKEKVELLLEDTFWLSKTPKVPSKSWDAALPRICTYGRFKLKSTGKEFLVFNTHFDHVGVEARKQSTELILRTIKQLNTGDIPVVLMGDFNLEDSSLEVQMITEQMRDTFNPSEQGPQGTFNGFDMDKPITSRIDYIFVKGFQVLKSSIPNELFVGRYPSDHLPVYAILNFKSGQSQD